jgi:subtilisin family serine protease
MSNLHEKLMSESSWYNTWHSHKGHGLAHWFLFFFIAVLITSAVSEGINKNYLSDNLNLAAAVIATKPTLPVKASKPISGQYIVVFKDDVKDPKGLATQLTKDYSGQLLFSYTKAIKGFAAKIPDIAINGLKKNPNIKFVEQDQTVSANTIQTPTGSWGLDRIDQSPLPLDNSYTYNYTGAGVNAYIIDTGIRITHTQFEGRATWDFDANYVSPSCVDTAMHWHGTHVAGTVGGKDYGVAKGVKLHSVRVLDNCGSGTVAGIISGIDWVANNKILPAVTNMSISGGKSDSMNLAVKNLINSGVVVVVAAGNSAYDACQYSPSSEPMAITVGATDKYDEKAGWSNYGTCVDVFAPGVDIYSAWNTNDTSLGSAQGTSMASPHVAGAAALYLEQNPTATPVQVAEAIRSKATTGGLKTILTGSPNILLNSLFNGTAISPTFDTQAPSVPTNLLAQSQYPTEVKLYWDYSTDNNYVAGYKVYKNSSLLATISGNNPTYSDYQVAGGVTYTYKVAAYDASGNISDFSNNASVTTPPPINPGTPVDIVSYSIENILGTSATVKWTTNVNNSTGSIRYNDRKSAPMTINDPNIGYVHYIYLKNLKYGTSYSYTITATDSFTSDSVTGTFKTRRN